MQNPRDLLVLLFALFWASSLAAASRYHGFPTASLLNWWEEPGGRPQRCLRLITSILLLNIVPVFLLWALWEWVVIPTDEWQALPGDDHRRFLGFFGAAMASPSVFAMIRFYHAFVASKGTIKWFYSPDEIKDFAGTIQGSCERERPFLTHFIPAIVYLAWWGGIAWYIKYLMR